MDAQLQAAVSDRSSLDNASAEDPQDDTNHWHESGAVDELTTKPTPK